VSNVVIVLLLTWFGACRRSHIASRSITTATVAVSSGATFEWAVTS
jgi:hypothetical protein